MIRVGEINQFIVSRETDLGYMLNNKGDEVLLHFNQTNDEVLHMNEQVSAFIQYDSQGRLAATLQEPSATVKKAGFGRRRGPCLYWRVPLHKDRGDADGSDGTCTGA